MRTRNVSVESLAAVGITGGLAVAVILGVILLVACLSTVIYGLGGLLFAYLWNTFVVPNVGTDLPTILWWQMALILLALRVLLGFIMPTTSSS